MESKHTILIVDDEESILNSLQRVFHKEGYELITARSGQEGLARLKEEGKEFSLIISDQRMPGMNGVEFLEKAKNIFPQAARILLTGYSDTEAVVEAINKGGIHRYMAKPWNEEELLFHVHQALKQYDLVVENQKLLALTKEQNEELKELNLHLEEKVLQRTSEINEKNKELEASLYNTVRAFGSLVEMHNPLLAGHERRVGVLSREIAQALTLPEEESTQIEIAALLHDIGKLGFPQRILEYQEDRWNAEDKTLYQKHPKQSQATVQFINKLDNVGILIRGHHERYDGQGFPDQLAEEEIPLGAKIISVADAYDKIANLRLGLSPSLQETMREIRSTQGHLTENEVWQKVAIEHLKRQSILQFDPDVVKVFLNYLASKGIYKGEKKVGVDDLKEGMVLSRPLYTSWGRFLLPHRATLTKSHIQKLKALSESESLQEMIYVVKK